MCEEENWYVYCETEAATWADCLAFYAKIGCALKSLADICELNHWSLEVLEGRAVLLDAA